MGWCEAININHDDHETFVQQTKITRDSFLIKMYTLVLKFHSDDYIMVYRIWARRRLAITTLILCQPFTRPFHAFIKIYL
jgi:hypothetical protein